MAIIPWNKEYGETLKSTLERFREIHPEYKTSKVTYAGRLDPMAEGLLLLLTDEDVHRKEAFLKYDKTYHVDFILGVATDSYDILGLITDTQGATVDEKIVNASINNLVNIVEQEYPPYSSRPVLGKPLWQHEREGSIDKIDIPKRKVMISSVTTTNLQELPAHEFKSLIIDAIQRVKGDFRQEEILRSWEEYFTKGPQFFTLYTIEVDASSGTYMRGLINTLGKTLGVGATTVKITRKRLGTYTQNN